MIAWLLALLRIVRLADVSLALVRTRLNRRSIVRSVFAFMLALLVSSTIVVSALVSAASLLPHKGLVFTRTFREVIENWLLPTRDRASLLPLLSWSFGSVDRTLTVSIECIRLTDVTFRSLAKFRVFHSWSLWILEEASTFEVSDLRFFPGLFWILSVRLQHFAVFFLDFLFC